jgi:glycosyltransferase involved in cell wall biosynthesis
MKVIQIIPRIRKGGAERIVLDICNELSKRQGVEVLLITFNDDNGYPFLTDNLNWKVVPSSINLSMWHKNVLNVDELQKTIDDFKPDIIHSHLFESEIVSRSCYYPKAKWFSHCHDNMKQFRNFMLETLFDKSLLTNHFEKRYIVDRYRKNGGTHFIAVSKDTLSYFKKSVGFPVTFMPNAINFDMFYLQRDYASHGSKVRLVNTGTLNDNKNQILLLKIAKELARRNYDFELNLLGDGPNRKMLEGFVVSMGLEEKVFVRGAVNDVQDYLHNSDIYLHSSLSEALPLSNIEAMAAGLPIIILDGKGNRDLVEQGKNGYMIYEQDVNQFADRIAEVWNDKSKYREMSKYAQNFAKEYDIKVYVDKLLNMYES